MKEVILIGGKHHRERKTIEDRQHTIRIAHPVPIRAFSKEDFARIDPLEFDEYCSVSSIFGEYGIIPDNVFLHKDLNPILFLTNLVKDYVK